MQATGTTIRHTIAGALPLCSSFPWYKDDDNNRDHESVSRSFFRLRGWEGDAFGWLGRSEDRGAKDEPSIMT